MEIPERLAAACEEELVRLERGDVLRRIWHRDHTVWSSDPTEIANRLGWLDVVDTMGSELERLGRFADEVRKDGFDRVVVLGMGGSSLGAAALADACDRRHLRILDSTVPGAILRLEDELDLRRTLFVVSSKSGTTTETRALADHFWERVGAELAELGATETRGERFVAVTDPGTALADLARERGFRVLFLTPPDIGGRFSVLSHFGLAPAAAAGLDLGPLLDGARTAAEASSATTPVRDSPAATLAALLAVANRERPILSLLVTPRLAGFALWAEQLLAESLGKDGQGVVPVIDEPIDRDDVGLDTVRTSRLFVALRHEADDAPELDQRVERLRTAGCSVVELPIGTDEELGAELFRWQLATAAAGHLLGVQPFEQPNVEAAKRRTTALLAGVEVGERPRRHRDSNDEFPGAVERAVAADRPTYVALLVYADRTAALDTALDALRGRLLAEHGLATTIGCGPRYLHSTGQLHKGGRPDGLFVFLVERLIEREVVREVARDSDPLPVPGRPYDFGVLARAQASGDAQALEELGRRTLWIELPRRREGLTRPRRGDRPGSAPPAP